MNRDHIFDALIECKYTLRLSLSHLVGVCIQRLQLRVQLTCPECVQLAGSSGDAAGQTQLQLTTWCESKTNASILQFYTQDFWRVRSLTPRDRMRACANLSAFPG